MEPNDKTLKDPFQKSAMETYLQKNINHLQASHFNIKV